MPAYSGCDFGKRAVYSSFVVLVVCACPLQAQKQAASEKPPASVVPPSAETMTPALSTLKQSVELSCRQEPLSDVLASLQKQSGVTLKVTPDWIGGMSVTAYTGKMPLGDVLRRLAGLYDLSWRQEAPVPAAAPIPVPPGALQSGPPVASQLASSADGSVSAPAYVLYESAANQRDIARLKRLRWDPLRLRVARIREYAAYTPEQLAQKAREGDKQAQALLDPPMRAKVALLANVDEEMLEALIDKEAKTFSFAQLPANTQQAMRFLVDQQSDRLLESGHQAEAQGIPQPPFVKEAPENYSVRYTVSGEGASANVHYSLLRRSILVTTDSAMNATGGDNKVWWQEWYARGQRTVLPALSVEKRKVPTEARFDMTDWPDALRLMHEKWQVNVFSDAYPEVPDAEKLSRLFVTTARAGENLEDGLTHSSLWNRVWWQEGEQGTDILFLRFDWYNWRDGGEWYALKQRLEQLKARKESPTLEDLALVATLSQPRLYVVGINPPINGTWNDANRDALRFYGVLKEAEKKRLWSGGLEPSTLSLAMQRRLLQAVQSRNAHATEDWLHGATLCLDAAKGMSELYFKADDANNPVTACRWKMHAVPAALAATAGGGEQDHVIIKPAG